MRLAGARLLVARGVDEALRFLAVALGLADALRCFVEVRALVEWGVALRLLGVGVDFVGIRATLELEGVQFGRAVGVGTEGM